jgi:hypothetical protein
MAEEIKTQVPQVPETVQMTKATAKVTVPVQDMPMWEKNGFVVVKGEPQK